MNKLSRRVIAAQSMHRMQSIPKNEVDITNVQRICVCKMEGSAFKETAINLFIGSMGTHNYPPCHGLSQAIATISSIKYQVL